MSKCPNQVCIYETPKSLSECPRCGGAMSGDTETENEPEEDQDEEQEEDEPDPTEAPPDPTEAPAVKATSHRVVPSPTQRRKLLDRMASKRKK
jgi:hypothetical protein